MSDPKKLRRSSAEYTKMADAVDTFVSRGERMRPVERQHLRPDAEKAIQFLRDAATWAKGRGE
ncbi:hypothetical protein [Azorhizobium doebereinerae]|uniref:hypothetical protein n=1 Tax=Azorhizobium doebereinerae TaxID=281091 RepID=UPI0004038C43|nr:hypothetical protein [Azorhizobium doebereinerae]